jgi:tetratricopeptide (TPR) repeat protein
MAKVSLRAYNQEIEAMIDRGHLDEAIAHCRHILKTFPKHLDTYRLLGKAFLEYKRYPEAADIFTRVLVSAPSDFVANVGMSIIGDEGNKLDDAIWHMERAFETQPSNAAIQSELQRLYGRREGVAPPRIRMTRGALAHMYVQGELYPQAISEIKSVLKEDPGRNDMQTLLARAYYRSGLKNDAAEVASAVLRSNPYNLDANRVLVEILGVDHPESVQAYRQRVVELDPYAAQVPGSIFMTNEVPDAAVSLEHLDWNGQPVSMQPGWEATPAVSLESDQRRDEQPDWLRNTFSESPAPSQPTPVSPFDAAPPSAKPPESVDNIPDFLREAGWGQSTGAFDESKSPFAESEPASTGAPIEQGDLPDWVKALAPEQSAERPAQEEELPDWINKIGTSALPTASPEEHRDYSEASEQPDWMNQLSQPPAQPAEEQPDWLKGFGTSEQPAEPVSEEPDWLKGFGSESESSPAPATSGELDWLSQLGSETKETETPANEFDFLNQPAGELNSAPSMPSDLSFLDELTSQPETASAAPSTDEFDFLNELAQEGEQLAPSSTISDEAKTTSPAAATLGMSEEEQDDSFAWLENLAAKQGATEGLLTKPEERLEEEPDWIKQVKGVETAQPPTEQPPVIEPAANRAEELGKSEHERDDAFAWLESLAAKQGASEGLLTKPEERLEEEPEWVRQAKSLNEQPQEVPAAPTPQEEQPAVTESIASLEDLGKSEQERDDAFAWLESLAAKQGATEGLLTKPEERLEEEPEWVKHAKDVSAQEPPVAELQPEPSASIDDTETWLRSLDEEEITAQKPQERLEQEPAWLEQSREVHAEEPVAEDETRVWLRGLDKEAATPVPESPARLEETPDWMKPEEVRAEETPPAAPVAEPSLDQTAAWLRSLEEEETTPEPVSAHDDTAMWLKSLDEEKPEEVFPQSAEAMPADELPAWMQSLEEEKPVEEGVPTAPEASLESTEATEWMSAIEQQPEPVVQEPPKIETGSLPSWLRGLEKEEETQEPTFAEQGDLPAWLRDDTGELVVEPTKIEPTRATDWQPAESQQPEPEPTVPEPVSQVPEPEPIVMEPVASIPQPEPVDVVSIIEEKIATPVSEPEQPVPPARPRKEPMKPKGTGALTDPVLGQARGELSRNNVSVALENYDRLIRKGRFLEDVIYDLREALYRYPVDISIWQSLGDAYMRSNRLQDALDAYTKAEELLR